MSKYTFQDPISPIMYGISALHDHILFFLAVILFVVAFIFITTISEFAYACNKTPKVVKDDLDFLFELPRTWYIQCRVWAGREGDSYCSEKFSSQ